eukprot:COSAG05_NODE_1438_length_4885_cov_3.395529_3_plen_120_part_00
MKRVDGNGKPLEESVAMSKAYRRALGKFHPDRQRNKPLPEQLEAEEKFKLLRRCYESYCASGVNNGRSPSGRSSGFGSPGEQASSSSSSYGGNGGRTPRGPRAPTGKGPRPPPTSRPAN